MNIGNGCLLGALLASVLLADVEGGEKVTACYGGAGCSFLKPQCDNDEVVEVTDVQYGYKTDTSCQNPYTVCTPMCCEEKKGDCKYDYTITKRMNVYERCSGRVLNCSVQVERTSINNCDSPTSLVWTTYAIMSYNCVKKFRIQMGCRAIYVRSKEIHTMLNDFSGCSGLLCTATSSKEIKVEAVDVRLQRSDGRCSATHLSVNNVHLNCENDTFFFGHSIRLEHKNTVEINISRLSLDNTPSMIWIKLKGSQQITLNCTKYDMPSSQSPVTVPSSALITTGTSPHGSTSPEPTTKPSDKQSTMSSNPVTSPHGSTVSRTSTKSTMSSNVVRPVSTTTRIPVQSSVRADASVSSDASDSVPIIVSVILVVLLVAVAAFVFYLWRKGKCLTKPKLKSIFDIGRSSESHENEGYNYVDPNKIDCDRKWTRKELPAVSMPPVGNYFELEPQYTEPEVRDSTYAEIPEEYRGPDDNPAISEYDKLGPKQKLNETTEKSNVYTHIKLNENTPYCHVDKKGNGEGSKRKPLSEYSHIQLSQADGILSDTSEYSKLGGCKQEDRTETADTRKENAYTYDYTHGNTNVDGIDTYSHLHASKA